MVFLVGLVLLTFSCKELKMGDKQMEITNENVAGVWKAEAFDSKMPNVSPEEMQAGEVEFLSSTYSLHPDHTFELHSNSFEAGARGRWSLNPEIKELTMSYEMGSEHGVEIYTVQELTENFMTLRVDIPEMEGYVQLRLKR